LASNGDGNKDRCHAIVDNDHVETGTDTNATGKAIEERCFLYGPYGYLTRQTSQVMEMETKTIAMQWLIMTTWKP
jgi:hypothetical protein